MKRAPIRDILWLFLLTRLLLVLVTYFGFVLLTAPKYLSTPVNIVGLFTSWNQWDGANYVRIAQFGYMTHFDVAFFPLFPLLIAAIAYPLGSWSYLAVGMVLSNAALLGAMFVLYQLAVDIAGEQVGRRTLLYLTIFPTALFFFAPYNESLFVLLIAGGFLALRRQHWWLAGILGMLAALTRSAGLLFVIPYLIEVWISRESITAGRQRLLLRLFPVVLIPLGTVLYSIYCWHIQGNPIAYVSVESHWGRQTTWPWMGIVQAFVSLFWSQPFGSFYEAHTLLDLSATLGFIFLAIKGWRWLRLSYSVWIAILLLFTLLSPSLSAGDALVSNQRLVLEMFPAFITLAMLGAKHPRVHQALILVFPVLLATLSLLFVMGRWMV
ncbi:MAG TPA: mannosyltransferase family protein [Ktedonobacteraceae bacterium]|nr:mannosyltransferase family protein [Ktedonobacteraceae bacterium]